MSYKVFLSIKAGKQYKKLNSHIRDKIKSNLDGLKSILTKLLSYLANMPVYDI